MTETVHLRDIDEEIGTIILNLQLGGGLELGVVEQPDTVQVVNLDEQEGEVTFEIPLRIVRILAHVEVTVRL